MVGALLAILTWAIALVVVIALGLPWTLALKGNKKRVITLRVLRLSLWIGLAISVLVVLATNLAVPLRSGPATIIGLVVLIASGALVAVQRPRLALGLCNRRNSAWGITVVAVVATVYFAVTAMGPVTNYDSGLYHIGAVRYAGDFATIPGIANVYQAFGYNNSEFPFAAAFTNGPWGVQGFRLANGFLIVLLCVELTLRWWGSRRGRTTYSLTVGAVCVLVPMVGLADYWVTSPTSDPAVFVLSIVAVCYLSDVLLRPARAVSSAAVAVAVSSLIVSMRPTMVFFAVAIVAVTFGALFIQRPAIRQCGYRTLGAGISVALALAAVQVLRDRLLSGWLMYPLSVLPFDVPWQALDPVNTRLSTLGAARDPANYLEAEHGWGWVGAWATQVPRNWEVYAWLAVLGLAIVLAAIRYKQGQRRWWSPRLLWAVTPMVVAIVTWWTISPPTFRFIWGPLFGLLVLPTGWLLHDVVVSSTSRVRSATVVSMSTAVAIGCVIVYSLVARVDWTNIKHTETFSLGPAKISYLAAPIPTPPTEDVAMPSGLVLTRPLPTDQCWMKYPLCTPLIEAEVVPRGEVADLPASISEGFSYQR